MIKLCLNCKHLTGVDKNSKVDKEKVGCAKNEKPFEGLTCPHFSHK